VSGAKNSSPFIPKATEVLLPQSNLVSVEGVELPLIEYAVHLGYIHWLLFGSPLMVMSGRDTATACSPLHAGGLAIDLRIHELTPAEIVLWYALLGHSAEARKIQFFALVTVPDGERFTHLQLVP
jgi:hypothetical protein